MNKSKKIFPVHGIGSEKYLYICGLVFGWVWKLLQSVQSQGSLKLFYKITLI